MKSTRCDRPRAGTALWPRTLLAVAAAVFVNAFAPPPPTAGAANRGVPPRPLLLVVRTRDAAFYNTPLEAFKKGLGARGYAPGKGVDLSVMTLEDDNAAADKRRLQESLRRKPQLILTLGTDATRLVAGERPAAPVLFSMILDPISLGLVKSADSPGGQFTGTTLLVSPGKQIDALLQAAPAARRIGVLFTEGDRTSLAFLEEARQDARRLNAEIVALGVPPGPQSVRAPLERLRGRIDAVWLILDPASTGPRALAETLDWAREQRLPVLGASGAMVQKGALLALSPHLQDLGESTAEMAVYLLQGGAQTALMRVRGPRRTLLSVNLETARALDVKIPGSVLHLADEVVEAKGGRP